MSEILIENCKLRQIANDYAEAINQGTVEKLEKFTKYWPTRGRLDEAAKQQPKKTRKWSSLPLFDFFSGKKVDQDDLDLTFSGWFEDEDEMKSRNGSRSGTPTASPVKKPPSK